MTKSTSISELAPAILDLVNKSQSILLHCHPSPDPDSVGSALAMKFALEQLGKKVTVIAGDSPTPEGFSHFPGYADIVKKSFSEIDWTQNPLPYDLFIMQDAGSIDMVSSLAPVIFPEGLKTIVIDHHVSNKKYARDINLVESSYPATTQILFDLFKLWNVRITPEIAANLFIGIFADTGGFRYASVTSDTFAAASELVKVYPQFSDMIYTMDNSNKPEGVFFKALALNNIELFLDGRLAISAVSYEQLKEKGINPENIFVHDISNILKSVVGWDVGVACVETEPGKVKVSFRTRAVKTFDLSVIAPRVGGGGHKEAAGAKIKGTIAEAKKQIVEAVRLSL